MINQRPFILQSAYPKEFDEDVFSKKKGLATPLFQATLKLFVFRLISTLQTGKYGALKSETFIIWSFAPFS